MKKLYFGLICISLAQGLLLRSLSRFHHVTSGLESAKVTIKERSENLLPPGRGKWPLFGDTFKLINAKTMGSYQTENRIKYGEIWKTSVFFKPTIFITGTQNLKSIFTEEAKKKTSAFFPPHHKKLFGENSVLVQSGEKLENECTGFLISEEFSRTAQTRFYGCVKSQKTGTIRDVNPGKSLTDPRYQGPAEAL